MTAAPPSPPGATPAQARKTPRISWIWAIPALAALAGLFFVVWVKMQQGPEITISFQTADGLQAGKTQVRYKDLTVGTVKSIGFNEDRSKVLVKASLAAGNEYLARASSQFWVVRPRLDLNGVSGLGTLLSGAYIKVGTANGDSHSKYKFEGLNDPPEINLDRPGTRYIIRADNLGSIDVGSPVYYQRIPVGRVTGYSLDEQGRFVKLHVFVDAPHDQFVMQDTRFWNTSGVDLSLSTQGLNLRTESLVYVMIGGIAFASMPESGKQAAAPGQEFPLYADEQQAYAAQGGPRFRVRFRFDQSVRGLFVGAPVDFRGTNLGEVTAINIDFDPKLQKFFAVVDAYVYPARLNSAYEEIRGIQDPDHPGLAVVKPMVADGLRAQLRIGNVLTGQLYISMQMFPDAPPLKDFKVEGDPVRIPTIANDLDRLQQQLIHIVEKTDKIPFEQIGKGLQDVLASTSRLARRLDKETAPELTASLNTATQSLATVGDLLAPDSRLAENTSGALLEIARATQAIRQFLDYLQVYPESLRRGLPPGNR